MTDQIPIVFVRQYSPVSGNWPGISIALRCAKKWNPDGRVVFLADDKQPDEYKTIAEYHPMEKHSRLKDALAKVWPFFGVQDSWFLWASLSNWCVLCDWMNDTQTDFVCVVDCDVLIFCDVTKECQHWRQFSYAACNPCGTAQAPTFVHRHVLTEFCGWLVGIYQKSVTVPNHVYFDSKCCMSAFRLWHAMRPDLKVGNPCEFQVVDGQSVCWDHNMAMTWSGLETNETGKVVRFVAGQPTVRAYVNPAAKFTNWKDIRFQALHMWGPFKGQIGDYVRQSEASIT